MRPITLLQNKQQQAINSIDYMNGRNFGLEPDLPFINYSCIFGFFNGTQF